MLKRTVSTMCSAVMLASVFMFSVGVRPVFSEGEDVAELKQQIEMLKKRVEELESSQDQEQSQVSPRFFSRQPSRWDPFEEMEQMQAEMDRMFRNSFAFGGEESRGMFRSDMFYHDTFDIREEPDKYIIEFDMTDLNQAKVDIQVNAHVLTIKCEGQQEESKDTDNQMFRSQSYSSFMKSIPIPDDADTSKMQTKQEEDKLIITLPKKG